MQKFQCLLFVLKQSYISYYIFCMTVPLSKTLQNLSISASQGQNLAHLVIKTLSKDTCDEKFELFWSNLMNKKQN